MTIYLNISKSEKGKVLQISELQYLNIGGTMEEIIEYILDKQVI
jgi:hypothetical protein